jgi:hypothetical protein
MGGIEAVADDERTETVPTPEWIEDTTHRLARIVLETYNALPTPTTPIATADTDE